MNTLIDTTTTPTQETIPQMTESALSLDNLHRVNESVPTARPPTDPPIRHLVVPGGGINGFTNYAILRDSNKDSFWSFSNLESIYATSSGSIIATIICLKYDWATLDDYLLKRPWHLVFKTELQVFLKAFSSRGLFELKQVREIFMPLFRGKDLSVDITLQEFYEWSGIDLHIFATELNDDICKDIDFSHTTHPNWKLIEAIYCSSCLPVFFQPFLKDGQCFVDGGVLKNTV